MPVSGWLIFSCMRANTANAATQTTSKAHTSQSPFHSEKKLTAMMSDARPIATNSSM